VYGTFTDHPYYNWLRGAGAANKGSINSNADYFKGIETLAKAAPKLHGSPLFRADLEEFAAGYLGGKVELLIMACDRALQEGDNEEAKKLDDQVTEYMLAMDRLLESHPNFRLDRWLAFARKHGKGNEKLADYYEKNARRLITVWGPPVNDYAARTWSGLIRDYYLPRHQLHMKGRFNPAEKVDVAKWELNWVERKHGVSQAKPYKDPVEAAVKLIAKTTPITADALKPKDNSKQVATWSPDQVSTEWKEISWPVSTQDLRQAGAVRFRFVRGSHRLDISEVKIELDGQIVADVKQDGFTGDTSSNCVYRFTLPAGTAGNNSCHIIARVRSNGGNNSYGSVELLPKKK
ncbi:MAG: alpha-N-acetylglucosaminidase C-terminal domain-containing protein, partial [Akkermansia sp.]|nr:alpha-N-acetylglucosaminidase C-terminal domain-containing protein [Akkermansia sp.]